MPCGPKKKGKPAARPISPGSSTTTCPCPKSKKPALRWFRRPAQAFLPIRKNTTSRAPLPETSPATNPSCLHYPPPNENIVRIPGKSSKLAVFSGSVVCRRRGGPMWPPCRARAGGDTTGHPRRGAPTHVNERQKRRPHFCSWQAFVDAGHPLVVQSLATRAHPRSSHGKGKNQVQGADRR